MRKRDELTDPNSCLNKASDDEMTFVLLGRDYAAPITVQAWISERIRLGKNVWEDAQIQEAEAWIRTVLTEQGRQLDFIDLVRHSTLTPEQKAEWEREVTDELRAKNARLLATCQLALPALQEAANRASTQEVGKRFLDVYLAVRDTITLAGESPEESPCKK